MGENLAFAPYSDLDGVNVMKGLIVDDGVTNRGHRSNAMNHIWTHAGVACGCHAQYGDVCCINYGVHLYDENPASETIDR